jgi:hypothetical protein
MEETAGTIGIPNIKNEILPYLDNYARRQERAASLEAARQKRQMELQYKQQQEAGKLAIPEIPSPKGGYFSKYIDNKRTAFVNNMVKDINEGKLTQGQVNTNFRSGISQIDSEDVNQAFSSKLLEQRAKELQEQGVVGANSGLIQAYADQGMNSTDPDKFIASPHLEGFTAYATGDYRNISPAKIMDNALKGKKPSKVKIESGNKTEDFEYWDIFNVGKEKDPVTGAEIITAQDVNIPAAEMYISADPNREKLKNNWIASKAKVLEADPQNAFLPDEEKKAKALEAATKQFYDEAGRAYKTKKYGVGYDEARAAGGGSKSKSAYAKFTTGMEDRRLSNNVQIPVYGIAAPTGTAFQLDLPQNTSYLNTATNQLETLSGSGAKITSPAVGYAAKSKATGKFIDPKDYGKTRASEVEFVPGLYGTKSTLQTKTGGGMFSSAGQGGPFLTGDQIFVEEGLPGWSVLASEIFKTKGTTLDAAKKMSLKKMKAKFSNRF